MNATETIERVVPRPVVLGKEWGVLGRIVHVRVRINGSYLYTSRIRKPGQTTLEVVKLVRREFRRVA